ncbi:segregation/condensation protein A [bacterium]|nr:segregation/condensation protein A [bacterium]
MISYQVKLPIFEGPFDLLFHLIEEQKIDIYDIPIAQITTQYIDYLHMMDILDLEVASGFLVMAATLLEIKSKMLLPKNHPLTQPDFEDEDNQASREPDARDGLVAKIVEYRRFRLIALELREFERKSSRFFSRNTEYSGRPEEILEIKIDLTDLLHLFEGVVKRRLFPPMHRIFLDRLSLADRIEEIKQILNKSQRPINFNSIIKDSRTRFDIVLSFLAILEMAKSGHVYLEQQANFKPIEIGFATSSFEIQGEFATG